MIKPVGDSTGDFRDGQMGISHLENTQSGQNQVALARHPHAWDHHLGKNEQIGVLYDHRRPPRKVFCINHLVGEDAEFVKVGKSQIEKLLTNYAACSIMWLDDRRLTRYPR